VLQTILDLIPLEVFAAGLVVVWVRQFVCTQFVDRRSCKYGA
jgi:hypothetical protein